MFGAAAAYLACRSLYENQNLRPYPLRPAIRFAVLVLGFAYSVGPGKTASGCVLVGSVEARSSGAVVVANQYRPAMY